tara:strand:- start:300 stop:473 length:174 start_codon:yes stop_codon:yes gene_type:complete
LDKLEILILLDLNIGPIIDKSVPDKIEENLKPINLNIKNKNIIKINWKKYFILFINF